MDQIDGQSDENSKSEDSDDESYHPSGDVEDDESDFVGFYEPLDDTYNTKDLLYDKIIYQISRAALLP